MLSRHLCQVLSLSLTLVPGICHVMPAYLCHVSSCLHIYAMPPSMPCLQLSAICRLHTLNEPVHICRLPFIYVVSRSCMSSPVHICRLISSSPPPPTSGGLSYLLCSLIKNVVSIDLGVVSIDLRQLYAMWCFIYICAVSCVIYVLCRVWMCVLSAMSCVIYVV